MRARAVVVHTLIPESISCTRMFAAFVQSIRGAGSNPSSPGGSPASTITGGLSALTAKWPQSLWTLRRQLFIEICVPAFVSFSRHNTVQAPSATRGGPWGRHGEGGGSGCRGSSSSGSCCGG
jgi:hypothetical protein